VWTWAPRNDDAEPGKSDGVTPNFTLAQNSAQQAEEPNDQQDNENSPEHAAEARPAIVAIDVISASPNNNNNITMIRSVLILRLDCLPAVCAYSHFLRYWHCRALGTGGSQAPVGGK
jgi:hypothetical protein